MRVGKIRSIYKKNPPHRDLNPRPSGLQYSALTTTLPRDYKVLVGISEGIKTFGRPRGCEGVDWIPLNEDRAICWVLVTTVTNHRVQLKCMNFSTV
jgi:hypothetical protein